MKEAVQSSKAKVKHTFQILNMMKILLITDLPKIIDELLISLGDEENESSLSHVYYNVSSEHIEDGIKQGQLKEKLNINKLG